VTTPSSRPGGAASLIGTVVGGRYKLERVIGEGGMSAVYAGEHVHMHKPVAVKVLSPEMSKSGEAVERFHREAMAASRIDHPNVAAATDFGELEDKSFFLVLELIAGKTLREIVQVFTRPDMERRLKLLIAKHMVDIEAGSSGFGGDGSVIVTERNKAAMNVLSDTIAQGKKKISLFYGAAHMPDFAKRLESMGFKPVATEWRMAWDLKIRDDQPSAIEDFLIEGLKALSEE